MPSYVTPKKNTQFVFYVSLTSQANTDIFQVNPTLVAGDVKVSIDGGPLNNITLPVVTPAGSKLVKVVLSVAEMNGDNIMVVFSDVAGAEWQDLMVLIQTTANQVDNLSVLTQANILSDATPFPGADIDAAISSRAAPGAAMTLSDNAVTAAKIAADAIGADEISLAAAIKIADEVLKRGVSNVQDTADTTSLAAMILAALESAIVGTTWTIRKTDGTTFTVKTVTTSAAALPITGVT